MSRGWWGSRGGGCQGWWGYRSGRSLGVVGV